MLHRVMHATRVGLPGLCTALLLLAFALVGPVLAAADDPLARRADELRKSAPSGFTVVTAPPFVVLGDGGPDWVAQGRETVQWAVTLLKKDYFDKDPADIIEVWLFKDAAGYEKHCRERFHTAPSSPFGFYLAENRALLMNFSTGGGTLVHELVHPFMAANFPACPAWFNEGLASLYEQSASRRGHIVGRTNWRLAGLQKAIREKTLPALDKLLATTTGEFYSDARATHYAQARYLCYYLQEKDLLHRFYRDFRRDAAKDPTGAATLRAVLGEADLAAFDTRWREYVMQLTFP